MEHSLIVHQMATLILCLMTSYVTGSYIIKTDTAINEITCWTCPFKNNNEDCNNWAPDVACPIENTVCRTVHRLHKDSRKSVSVIKQCAPPTSCDVNHVGCKMVGDSNHMECVSCCDYSYCNEAVPTNITTAFKLSASLFNSAATYRPTSGITSWMSHLFFILLARGFHSYFFQR